MKQFQTKYIIIYSCSFRYLLLKFEVVHLYEWCAGRKEYSRGELTRQRLERNANGTARSIRKLKCYLRPLASAFPEVKDDFRQRKCEYLCLFLRGFLPIPIQDAIYGRKISWFILFIAKFFCPNQCKTFVLVENIVIFAFSRRFFLSKSIKNTSLGR